MKEEKKKIKVSSSWLVIIILFLSIAISYFVFWHSDLLLQYPIAIIGVASVFVAAAGVIYSKEKEWQIKQLEIDHEKIMKDKEIAHEQEQDRISFQREKKEEFYVTLNLFDRALDELITAADKYHFNRVEFGKLSKMIEKLNEEKVKSAQEMLDKLVEDISRYDQEMHSRKDAYDQLLSKLIVLQSIHQFVDSIYYNILMSEIKMAIEKNLYELDSQEKLDEATESSRKIAKTIHKRIIYLTENILPT